MSAKRRNHLIGYPDGSGVLRRTTYQPGAPTTGAPLKSCSGGVADPAGQRLTGGGRIRLKPEKSPTSVSDLSASQRTLSRGEARASGVAEGPTNGSFSAAC
jgi:hypothetical protein